MLIMLLVPVCIAGAFFLSRRPDIRLPRHAADRAVTAASASRRVARSGPVGARGARSGRRAGGQAVRRSGGQAVRGKPPH